MIEDNYKDNTEILTSSTGLTYDIIQIILQKELNIKKICAKCVSYKLANDQKKTSVTFCQKNFKMF